MTGTLQGGWIRARMGDMAGPPRAPAGRGRRTAHTSMVTHVTDGAMEALRDRIICPGHRGPEDGAEESRGSDPRLPRPGLGGENLPPPGSLLGCIVCDPVPLPLLGLIRPGHNFLRRPLPAPAPAPSAWEFLWGWGQDGSLFPAGAQHRMRVRKEPIGLVSRGGPQRVCQVDGE